jgi:hypothetical protein
MILGAGDDARLAVGGKPHGLRPVELGVLKGRQAHQAVHQTGGQSLLGNVDLVGENQFQRRRQLARERRLLAPARGRQGPRFVFPFLLHRQAHAQDAPALLGFADDAFDLLPPYLAHVREKCPLVGPRHEAVIQEHAVAQLAWPSLQWQGNEVSEAAAGHRVLTGEEPIVRIQADVGSGLHRFCEEVGPEPACHCSRQSRLEEEPDVAALPGA